MAVEVFKFSYEWLGMMTMGLGPDALEPHAAKFIKDYHVPVDLDVFGEMMQTIRDILPVDLHPPFFLEVEKRYKGDFQKYAEILFSKSNLTSEPGYRKLLRAYGKEPWKGTSLLREDPIAECFLQFREVYLSRVDPVGHTLGLKEEKLYEDYLAGLLEMKGEHALYPDANRSLRITHGKVEGYRPRDAVRYQWNTSGAGLLEKHNSGAPEYGIPRRLDSLVRSGAFGRYGTDGRLPVNFIASNHTSGGNSGSPVMDARGDLIGLNFDREWEGTMSDVWYDPDLCRNISVDIRYLLFLIDEYAGAGYLLDEMDITW
jgi:hypothetical protein